MYDTKKERIIEDFLGLAIARRVIRHGSPQHINLRRVVDEFCKSKPTPEVQLDTALGTFRTQLLNIIQKELGL